MDYKYLRAREDISGYPGETFPHPPTPILQSSSSPAISGLVYFCSQHKPWSQQQHQPHFFCPQTWVECGGGAALTWREGNLCCIIIFYSNEIVHSGVFWWSEYGLNCMNPKSHLLLVHRDSLVLFGSTFFFYSSSSSPKFKLGQMIIPPSSTQPPPHFIS